MKLFLQWFALAVSFFGDFTLLMLLTLPAISAEVKPFISCSQTGGEMSAYRNITLRVSWSGTVRIEQRSPRNRTNEYAITPADIAALTNVLESVRFFDVPESNSVRSPGFPIYELTAESGGRSRALRFQYVESFAPLHKQLNRLMDQALIMSDLEGGDRNPRSLHPHTLSRLAFNDVDLPRPELVVPLLEKWADDYGNTATVNNVFSALARLTTPGEWMAFVTNRVNTAYEHHRAMLFSLFASRHLHSSMPTNHVRALLPYVTMVLECYGSPAIVLDETTEKILSEIIAFIRRMNYRDAVPALLKLAEAHPASRSGRSAQEAAKRLDKRPSVPRR